ncbi:hypothetical protein DFAR_1470019 [Desulfarculales bacterium]
MLDRRKNHCGIMQTTTAPCPGHQAHITGLGAPPQMQCMAHFSGICIPPTPLPLAADTRPDNRCRRQKRKFEKVLG